VLTNPAGVNDLTRTIIGCGVRVHRVLGPGLLESAYAACFELEMRESGLAVAVNKPVPLAYRGLRIDVSYRLDFLVNETVVVELKAVEAIAPIHLARVLTYLRLLGVPVGLIMNFNAKVLKDGVRRVINSPPK
jgi:GxxExxY protein